MRAVQRIYPIDNSASRNYGCEIQKLSLSFIQINID